MGLRLSAVKAFLCPGAKVEGHSSRVLGLQVLRFKSLRFCRFGSGSLSLGGGCKGRISCCLLVFVSFASLQQVIVEGFGFRFRIGVRGCRYFLSPRMPASESISSSDPSIFGLFFQSSRAGEPCSKDPAPMAYAAPNKTSEHETAKPWP